MGIEQPRTSPGSGARTGGTDCAHRDDLPAARQGSTGRPWAPPPPPGPPAPPRGRRRGFGGGPKKRAGPPPGGPGRAQGAGA
ncbi:hypothetical protein, partial [Nocardia asiatica]|uniref:hypothetical protein n=1 Tax=Nocardia asiatica TaxID=209252 RepID=UPI002457D056